METKSKRINFKKFRIYLKCYKSLLLSHHPNCDKYDKNHTIKIGKNRFCIGCFIGYPSAIIMILIMFYFKIYILMERTSLLIFGLILISSIILSPLNLTKVKIIKIIQKILIGIGSAFIFWWIWSSSEPFYITMLLFISTFGLLITLLNLYHGFGFYTTCKKCTYSLDWKICPGFKEINDCLEKNNLHQFSS